MFWLWRRSLNLLILLVPYAIFRTPPRNWNFIGNIALVQKWPKCRFPLCDAGLRVSEHPPVWAEAPGIRKSIPSLLTCSYCDTTACRCSLPCPACFNPLYWGVLIVTKGRELVGQKPHLFQSSWSDFIVTFFVSHPSVTRREAFQSSLLRCSHCDRLPPHLPTHKLPFQSSLLRCSHCDDTKRKTQKPVNIIVVSILFTEVFSLWH